MLELNKFYRTEKKFRQKQKFTYAFIYYRFIFDNFMHF